MNKQNGYVLDTTYPVFFYKEMQPLWLKTIVSFLGFQTPDITEEFSYLELGCATGVNLIVAAINNPDGNFVGIDFNQQHIEKAKQLANSIGVKNIKFIHTDFAHFLVENKCKFDFIVNHGTFSWVSPEVQKNILDIVAHFLNNTGLFYLHYMCYPASASLHSVQKLLSLVDHHTDNSSLKSIELGKKLFDELNRADAFIDNSRIDAIVRTLNQDHSYLVHEFLTDYWQPLYSVDVHQMVFQATQSNYIGSANSIENLESLSIPAKLKTIVENINAPALKEYVKDLARNAKQRMDVFQYQPHILNNAEHSEIINQIEFKLLPDAPKNSDVTFRTPIGDINAPQEVISPMFESLVKKDMRFDELLDLSAFKDQPMFLIETIFLAMNAGYLHPTLTHIDQNQVRKFNEMMQKEGIKIRM